MIQENYGETIFFVFLWGSLVLILTVMSEWGYVICCEPDLQPFFSFRSISKRNNNPELNPFSKSGPVGARKAHEL